MEKFSFFCPIHNGVTFNRARLSRAQTSGDEPPQPGVFEATTMQSGW
jgi:hypothetical protein